MPTFDPHIPDRTTNGRSPPTESPGGPRQERATPKQAKKPGAAQTTARDVAGLKDYVRATDVRPHKAWERADRAVDSNWATVSARVRSDPCTAH